MHTCTLLLNNIRDFHNPHDIEKVLTNQNMSYGMYMYKVEISAWSEKQSAMKSSWTTLIALFYLLISCAILPLFSLDHYHFLNDVFYKF